MRSSILGCLWPLVAVLWLTILGESWGKIPALGPLLDLHSGVWDHQDFSWQNRKLRGLRAPVQVAIDKAGIPHLFAQSQADVFLAQGYIVAAHRLFQMDLYSRATSGNLTELVGEKGLPVDRFFIRLGMRQALLQAVNNYEGDPQISSMLNAYVAGANDYIRDLKKLPIEYKILQRHPKFFDASMVVKMIKTLTFSLNGRNSGTVLSHLQTQMSNEKILDLFPEFLPDEYSDYVLPGAWSETKRAPETAAQFAFKTHIQHIPDLLQPRKGNGSNNWVVGPSKSKTGHSILSNETHLDYSLPNIWFENQLYCPEFNTYGVSLVDSPGVVAGFNPNTAWGTTNGTTAALDVYEVEFADDTSLSYRDGDHLLEAQVFHEPIQIANGESEEVVVPWTKWGPVFYREGRYGLVVNWTGHLAGRELLTISELAKSRNVSECLTAFHEWRVPIQNFVCADADHIALIHAGFIPKRSIGEGRFIEPAGKSKTYLSEPIPEHLRPMRIDPREGYLRSANERVVDETYPEYLGWDYEEPFRGMLIRQRLEGQEKFSGLDMVALQSDDVDGQAPFFLPTLLQVVERQSLSAEQRQALESLAKWDYHTRAESIEPALFKAWYNQLKSAIFDDEYKLNRKDFYPHDLRIAWMLKRVAKNPKDSDSQWIDNKATPEKETINQIATAAFKQAWADLETKYGRDPQKWTWKNYNKTQFGHLLGLPGFGSKVLATNGSRESIRGNQGFHGQVHKLVVELGQAVRAWIQVPGGNQGDPLSTQYGQGLEEWSRGEMREVEFYTDLADARARAQQLIEFTPEAN